MFLQMTGENLNNGICTNDSEESYQSLLRVMHGRLGNISKYLSGEMEEYNSKMEVIVY